MTEHPIDDAAFLGKLTAGATHEIRNVLSVIKESVGLMEDLLDVGGDGTFAHEDKFRKMIGNILAQVERGSAVAKELNTLAHAPDDRLRSVDVDQVLRCQSVLFARFCRGKEVSLTARCSSSQTFVTTDPVLLHSAVCSVIDALLAQSSPGSEITLTCESNGGRVEIVFAVRSENGELREVSEDADTSGALETARRVVFALGGEFAGGGGESTVRVALAK